MLQNAINATENSLTCGCGKNINIVPVFIHKKNCKKNSEIEEFEKNKKIKEK